MSPALEDRVAETAVDVLPGEVRQVSAARVRTRLVTVLLGQLHERLLELVGLADERLERVIPGLGGLPGLLPCRIGLREGSCSVRVVLGRVEDVTDLHLVARPLALGLGDVDLLDAALGRCGLDDVGHDPLLERLAGHVCPDRRTVGLERDLVGDDLVLVGRVHPLGLDLAHPPDPVDAVLALDDLGRDVDVDGEYGRHERLVERVLPVDPAQVAALRRRRVGRHDASDLLERLAAADVGQRLVGRRLRRLLLCCRRLVLAVVRLRLDVDDPDVALLGRRRLLDELRVDRGLIDRDAELGGQALLEQSVDEPLEGDRCELALLPGLHDELELLVLLRLGQAAVVERIANLALGDVEPEVLDQDPLPELVLGDVDPVHPGDRREVVAVPARARGGTEDEDREQDHAAECEVGVEGATAGRVVGRPMCALHDGFGSKGHGVWMALRGGCAARRSRRPGTGRLSYPMRAGDPADQPAPRRRTCRGRTSRSPERFVVSTTRSAPAKTASQSIASWGVTITATSAPSIAPGRETEFVLAAVGVAEPFDVRIVDRDRRTAPAKAGDDLGGGRVPGIAHVGLEGDTEDRDPRTLDRLAPVVERLGHQVDDVAGHREVDVARELDEAVDEVELRGHARRGSTDRPGCSARRRRGRAGRA